MPQDEFCTCIHNCMFILFFMQHCAFLLYIACNIESTPLIMFLTVKAVTGTLSLIKPVSTRNYILFLLSLLQFSLHQSINL
jgi:hypothetical protein